MLGFFFMFYHRFHCYRVHDLWNQNVLCRRLLSIKQQQQSANSESNWFIVFYWFIVAQSGVGNSQKRTLKDIEMYHMKVINYVQFITLPSIPRYPQILCRFYSNVSDAASLFQTNHMVHWNAPRGHFFCVASWLLSTAWCCEWTSRSSKKSRCHSRKMPSHGAFHYAMWLVWNKLAASKCYSEDGKKIVGVMVYWEKYRLISNNDKRKSVSRTWHILWKFTWHVAAGSTWSFPIAVYFSCRKDNFLALWDNLSLYEDAETTGGKPKWLWATEHGKWIICKQWQFWCL